MKLTETIYKIWKRYFPIILVAVLVHLVWCLLSYVFKVRSIFLPTPKNTYTTLISLIYSSSFWLDVGFSTLRVTLAFVFSFLIAYPLVLGAVLNNSLKKGIFIIAEFFRYLPVPVFVPLTILWFGVSDVGKIVVVLLGTFAQMIPMFYDSTLLVRNSYDSAVAALKWDAKDIVKRVIITGSAPYIFDNARLCLGWAWTYLVVAELLGAKHGIGYAIIRAQRYLATDRIFAYIIVIGIVGITTDRLMRVIRRKLFSWA